MDTGWEDGAAVCKLKICPGFAARAKAEQRAFLNTNSQSPLASC